MLVVRDFVAPEDGDAPLSTVTIATALLRRNAVVHPWAVEIRDLRPALRRLQWIELGELVRSRSVLLDGHLRVVALRAAHALGVLGG